MIAIVHPIRGYEFPAEQLADYIQRITGTRPALTAKPVEARGRSMVFVIGAPAANDLARAIDDSEGGRLSAALKREGCYVVWPCRYGGRAHVVCAGGDAVTTAYAVFAYLGRSCKAGFFHDGDHVPRHRLAMPREPFISAPRLQHRKGPLAAGSGHYGIPKFHVRYWTVDELKNEIRWMVQHGLNLMSQHMSMYHSGITRGLAREVCADLGYPIDPVVEEEEYISGFPSTWDWPPEYLVALTKEVFAYARSLGIRVIYNLRPGEVPLEFKRLYPQFAYVKRAELWEYAQIHPSDPFYEEFTARYLQRLVAVFGTDHLYGGAPYGETSPEKNPEENYALKKAAALGYMDLLRRVDPKAVWVTDSWDFFWSRDTWTQDRVREYLDAMPADGFFIYDCNPDNLGIPVHRVHANFHGKSWAFGVMHSAAGHDQLHGDFEDLLARVRAASDDPRGNGCSGMYLNPELIHYDPLYYEFLAKVAWDPMTVEPKTFLDDYALRRYGRAPYQPMRRFLGEVVEGLYTREMNIAVYKLTSFQWVWHHAAPWIQIHTIPRLARALATAFSVRERQEGNSLYVNDMVKVTFALLAEIAAWHWHGVHAAYAIGDGDGYDSAAVLCTEAVAWIARIASTREDLNIGRMIERVMSVPGTNRYTPRMIMQGLANWGYCSNDTHEQVANLYLPRMRDYFGKLRASLAARPPVDLKAMMPTLSPTMEEWKERPSSLERTITFDGSTLDGATEAYRWGVASIPRAVREGIPSRPGARRGWSLALATNGSWHEAPVGIRIEGELIESDPANGPTGISMHREFVEMCLWGSVTTAPASGLREVRLQDYPLLTIRYQTEAATGPAMLFAHFQSPSGSERRVRVWRTFGPAGSWTAETFDLLKAIRSHGEEPQQLLGLEIGLQTPPHRLRVASLELSG